MTIVAGDPGLMQAVSRCLARGGLVIAPCDTIYGIIGIAPDTEARIREVKGRGEDKPFLQLVAGVAWVEDMAEGPLPARLVGYWPGPLTLVVRRKSGGTVAVRVPDSEFLQTLVSGLGKPVFSTSVNRAGQPALWRIAEIRAEFEGDVDIVVDAGDLHGAAASTIVDVASHPARILRQGSLVIPESDLR